MAMSKRKLLAMVVLLFTIGLIAYQWSREFVVIRVEEGLHRASLPRIDFESSSPTKIDAWSGRSIDLIRGQKRLRISCSECFVTPRDGSDQIRFLTIHSRALTQEQIESLHSDYCVVFDAHEQIDRFASWAAGDQKELVSMNQFDGPRVYNLSVHRTYDKNSPWFASIEVAWPCKTARGERSSGE